MFLILPIALLERDLGILFKSRSEVIHFTSTLILTISWMYRYIPSIMIIYGPDVSDT